MNDSDGTATPSRPPPPKSSTRLANSSPLSQMVAMHNPIQLAAISNYKLAQLTFSPPDQDSLRKTALVKNMLEMLYEDTPPEWLDQMTRWEFFTPESLSDMTQETLEEMFAQYAQTIEAFQPLHMDDDDDDDDDDEESEMWIDEETIETGAPDVAVTPEPTIFTQINASVSSDSVANVYSPPAPSLPEPTPVEKPLPKSPTDDKLFNRRTSLTPSVRSKNRLSWTSDTGVLPTSSITQNMATELMSLFDMEFKVDIKLNTAPKLPELPFHQKDKKSRRQSERFSNGSLMELIPAFETFGMGDDLWKGSSTTSTLRANQLTFPPPPTAPPPNFDSDPRSSKRRSASFPPLYGDPMGRPPSTVGSVNVPPKRSSSLKYREQRNSFVPPVPVERKTKKSELRTKSSEFLATLAHALTPNQEPLPHKTDDANMASVPALSKKKSLRRLASLMSSKREKKVTMVEPVKDQPHSVYLNVPHTNEDIPRKSISSTNSSSSSWSSSSEILVAAKARTLTAIHNTLSGDRESVLQKRRSYTMAQPITMDVQDLRKARTTGRKFPAKHKKRRSSLLMETTASKRKSLQFQRPGLSEASASAENMSTSFDNDNVNTPLSRSKSAFIKIGSGFKSRRRSQRRSVIKADQDEVDWKRDVRRRSTIISQRRSLTRPELVSITENEALDPLQASVKPSQQGFVKRMATLGRRMKLQKT